MDSNIIYQSPELSELNVLVESGFATSTSGDFEAPDMSFGFEF